MSFCLPASLLSLLLDLLPLDGCPFGASASLVLASAPLLLDLLPFSSPHLLFGGSCLAWGAGEGEEDDEEEDDDESCLDLCGGAPCLVLSSSLGLRPRSASLGLTPSLGLA